MKAPSTAWREDIAPDEETRFAGYARQFALIQKILSRKHGKGRALHRKQLLGLKAEFEVLADLPDYARHGLFARPARYPAAIRLSNGSLQIQDDSKGDIRGFAVRVEGLKGPGALGAGDVSSQSFLLINQEAFSSPKSAEFVALVGAVAQGGSALIKHLFGTYGFFGGLARMRKAAATFGKSFSGFATEPFYTAVPIAVGPYAGRVRLLPARDQKPSADAKKDWGADMKRRVAAGDLVFDFQMQFFVDEALTPIEDASVNWKESDAPYVTVGRLTVPRQEFDSPAAQEFQASVEASVFDPWCALIEHRPLGDVMRARKHVYFASQQTRGAV